MPPQVAVESIATAVAAALVTLLESHELTKATATRLYQSKADAVTPVFIVRVDQTGWHCNVPSRGVAKLRVEIVARVSADSTTVAQLCALEDALESAMFRSATTLAAQLNALTEIHVYDRLLMLESQQRTQDNHMERAKIFELTAQQTAPS